MNDFLTIFGMLFLFLFILIGIPIILLLIIKKKNNYPIETEIIPLLGEEEHLLEYTKAYSGAGGAGVTAAFGLIGEGISSFSRKWYYLGISNKRFIVLQKGRQKKVTSYTLNEILSFGYERPGGWISSNTVPGLLTVNVRNGSYQFKAKGKKWWEHAAQMKSIFDELVKNPSN